MVEVDVKVEPLSQPSTLNTIEPSLFVESEDKFTPAQLEQPSEQSNTNLAEPSLIAKSGVISNSTQPENPAKEPNVIEPSPLVKSEDKSNPSQPEKTSAQPNPLIKAPTWKDCGAHSLLVQVQTRERAARASKRFLRETRESLVRHRSNVSSADKWIKRIDYIADRKRECRVLVGFRGSTGAGKSSVINAILGMEDLLPVDDGKACTAVSVEISWNGFDDTKPPYQAKISRVSWDDWEIELKNLFTDINDKELGKNGPNNEPDLERNIRIDSAFSKVKCVYPFINTNDELKVCGLDRLLQCKVPDVKSILENPLPEIFRDSDLPKFAKRVRSYISSDPSTILGGATFAQWPLVKLVELQVKSEILKDGIVLVDLPGNMDTNAARGEIAANYQKNLSITCPVSRAPRAMSDKPAHDLIGEVTQRTLQLDNHYSSDKLCFIMSQCDSSIMLERYIEANPKLQHDLAKEFQYVKSCNKSTDEALRWKEEKCNEGLVVNRARLDHQNEYNKLNQEIKRINDANGAPNRKRKQIGDDAAPRTFSQQERATIDRHTVVKKALKKLRTDTRNSKAEYNEALLRVEEWVRTNDSYIANSVSIQMKYCIQHRNKVAAEAIRKDYVLSLEQIGQEVGDKPLQVFGVSSWSYFRFENGKPPLEGFLSLADSGIPRLRDFLVETTLDIRDRNALSVLEDVENLKWSMAPWFADNSSGFKMSDTVKDTMEKMFATRLLDLRKNIADAHESVISACTKTVTKDLYSRFPACEKEAVLKAEQKVADWAQLPVRWSTHRATNKRLGVWSMKVDTPDQIDFEWNDDLTGIYHVPLLKNFNTTAYKKLPNHRHDYDLSVSQFIENFAVILTEEVVKICPQLTNAIAHWCESSKRAQGAIEKESRAIFVDRIEDVARDAHRKVKPKVVECWTPVYEECGAAYGRGHYQNNLKMHREHVQKSAPKMYKKGSKAIKSAFDELLKDLPVRLNGITIPIIAQIEEEFELLITNYSSLDENMDDLENMEAKTTLQKEITGHFQSLNTAWSIEIDVPIVPKEQVIEKPLRSIEDLKKRPVDPDYVEFSSDEDDEL